MMALFFRMLAGGDALWLGLRKRGSAAPKAVAAGAGVQSGVGIGWNRIGDVDWPEFPTLAHSFWRAQELTLFRRHARLYAEPALDLGCGDSLFGRLAGFPAGGVGIDLDPESLAAGRSIRPEFPCVMADVGCLPVRDRALSICLSNSVLEHLPDLSACFSETARVLGRGGRFVFSATLGEFTRQLQQLGGRGDAQRWVEMFGHHQEPTRAELLSKLEDAGYRIESCIVYQPLATTAIYRLLVSPAFQFLERRFRGLFRKALLGWLARRVSDSLKTAASETGACCFVVARLETGS